jgi:hypothetical protein
MASQDFSWFKIFLYFIVVAILLVPLIILINKKEAMDGDVVNRIRRNNKLAKEVLITS